LNEELRGRSWELSGVILHAVTHYQIRERASKQELKPLQANLDTTNDPGRQSDNLPILVPIIAFNVSAIVFHPDNVEDSFGAPQIGSAVRRLKTSVITAPTGLMRASWVSSSASQLM
jgi:hypothetical protein